MQFTLEAKVENVDGSDMLFLIMDCYDNKREIGMSLECAASDDFLLDAIKTLYYSFRYSDLSEELEE